MLGQADRLYLTQVHTAPKGDAYFPEIDKNLWREKKRIDHPKDEANAFACSFLILERA